MAQDQKDDGPRGIVTELAENLGAVFRHMLPGVLILSGAWLAHPSWFQTINIDQNAWPLLLVGAVLAIAIGNTWFALNRYVVHQLVDYGCYLAGSEGPAKKGKHAYFDDLAVYVREALVEATVPNRARQHVAFRASSVLLIYTLAELAILLALWNEPLTLPREHRLWFIVVGLVLFVFGVWQNVITRRIDAAVLHARVVQRN